MGVRPLLYVLLLASSSCPHDDTAININCSSSGSGDDGGHESCHLGLKYVIKGICQLVIKLIYWKAILHVYVQYMCLWIWIWPFLLHILRCLLLNISGYYHSLTHSATQTLFWSNWAEAFSLHISLKTWKLLNIFQHR